jgi:hypothetical protein
MEPHLYKKLRRLEKECKKLEQAQERMDWVLEHRPATRKIAAWDGVSQEKTVKLLLKERGFEVRRNPTATIDYRIRRGPDEEWRTLEVKADVLRPGQEKAQEYAVLLYPRKGTKAILLSTFDIPEMPPVNES